MSLIVQKFGGSSVRDAQRIRNVAGIIAETYLEGNDVLVVLSAQGDTTDDLIAKAEEINSHPSKREMDMLLSTGEQISVALCAMALESMGLPCVSLTAWQVGIQTTAVHGDARIKRIDSERVQAELDQHRIVLITGFQGMDRAGDVTTLGRGGSDTSAVALAAASVIFSWFMARSTNYSLVYGSLASVIILLVWLYLCGNILILGSVVNAVLYHHRLEKERAEGPETRRE